MNPNAPTHQDAHEAHHGHSHGHEAAHGTLASYTTGFILSAILTAIPFFLVMGKVFESRALTMGLILFFGAIQILVHMVCFLHMNSKSEGGWTIMALIFTLVLVAIALSGSLWVMYNLNVNMMPVSAEMMRNMP